jgi:type I restriction enzyme R subunit
MTEEDVKRLYITPAIEQKWDKFTQIKMEHCFTDGRVVVRGKSVKRLERKKADYILYYKKNFPIAIVEAKSDEYALSKGIQQAIEYAKILDIPFAYSSNGSAFLEHDMKEGFEREIRLEDFPDPNELWKRYKEEKGITSEQEKQITEPYYFQQEKIPRYYQRIAINRTIEAISRGEKRIMIVMATGTGKTYTAFQIIHNLWKTKKKRKILYLADRNILIDQTMQQDFSPFEKVMTKISEKKIDSSYEIYMSLYQQLAGDENEEPFREIQPNFFDLIIVDECHRGSAREDSLWRRILEYFECATQIGMTATPKETKDVSNRYYFGNPIYTYTLKQGIDDGFLAPYKVMRIGLNTDLEGYRPERGKIDIHGSIVEDREYNTQDFDRNLVIDERTKVVAAKITEVLKAGGDRFAKTIVFCVDIEHAERMRSALVNENAAMVSVDSRYIMKITGDDATGKAQLDNFIAEDSRYPVIVTTSELMTTGVDCKTCKFIVIDKNIESSLEFKQIIGRGTRIKEEYGKMYFTILDFRGATKQFAKDDFWAVPEQEDDFNPGSPVSPDNEVKDNDSEIDPLPLPSRKQRINGIDVTILSERVQYYDQDGKLTTESIIDYSKRNIKNEYATLDIFLKVWNSDRKKQAIVDELAERGVLLNELRQEIGNNDLDDFDLICHIAFNKKPLTRTERANNVKKRDYLNKYEGVALEVLSALLNKYQDGNIRDLTDSKVLELDPFRKIGRKEITEAFGGKYAFLTAVKDLQSEIYRCAS